MLRSLSSSWRQTLPALLAWSCLAVLPFGRVVEGVVILMAVLGLVHAVRKGRALLADARMRLLLGLFTVYWLPIALSLPAAVDVDRSVATAVAQFRFLFAGVYLVGTLNAAGLAVFLRLTAFLLLFWVADAMLQYTWGRNLLGFEPESHYLSGMFGPGTFKLTHTTSVFLPLLWEWLRQRFPAWMLAVAIPASIAFIILSGPRAAWITVSVAAACYCLLLEWGSRRLGRPLIMAVALIVVLGALASYYGSERVQRSAEDAYHALTAPGDPSSGSSINHRYWIWGTAIRMFLDNPVTGVGARNFRNAYADYASDDDPFYHGPDGETPTHSHQLLLEVAAETGTLGVIGLLLLWLILIRVVVRERGAGHPMVLPLAAGLAGAYFPLNTHLAVYSSYWSQILWFLIVLFCVCAHRVPHNHNPPRKAS